MLQREEGFGEKECWARIESLSKDMCASHEEVAKIVVCAGNTDELIDSQTPLTQIFHKKPSEILFFYKKKGRGTYEFTTGGIRGQKYRGIASPAPS